METYNRLYSGVKKNQHLYYEVRPITEISLDNLSSFFYVLASGEHRGHFLYECFICELNQILLCEELSEGLERIDRLDFYLQKIRDRLIELNEQVDILPSLSDIYQHLSPLVLRQMRELASNDVDREAFKHGIFEALKISIEEEVTVWQENF